MTAIRVGIGAIACLLAYGVARELKNDRAAWTVFGALVCVSSFWVAKQAGYRVWVHETGLSWRGMFETGEVGWQQIEQIYYSSFRISGPYHIPLGTYHRLKLVDVHGRTITFSERVARADVLLVWIQQKTRDEMFKKAAYLFNSGAEVDFGAVKLSKTEGVRVRRWYGEKRLRWHEIAECKFGDGVKFRGKTMLTGCKAGADRVANLEILQALLSTAVQR